MITLAVAALAISQVQGDKALLDSLIRQNTYTIRVENGRLAGPGADFILRESQDAQFVGLGENHNRLEIPQIATALFKELQNRAGFHYLCLESATIATGMMNEKPYVGSVENVRAFARKYPFALTFPSDQELQMIADVSGFSRAKGHPIWGLDQEFGVSHVLDQLQAQAGKVGREAIEALRAKVRPLEGKRENDHFLANQATAEDFSRLRQALKPRPGSLEEFEIDQLSKSEEIFEYYRRAVKGEPTGWKNNSVRESNMKDLFMREYRFAQAQGDRLPRVLMKFGQYHLYRGLNPADTLSTGNFVTELAKSNGMKSMLFFFAVRDNKEVPADHSWDFIRPFLEHANPNQWTVIDIRPLRDYWYGRMIPVINSEFARLLFGFDALFVIGSSKPATFDFAKVK